MPINYKPLWHLLIDKNMNKADLKDTANLTSNIIARMGKNQYITLESVEKICIALECTANDVFMFEKEVVMLNNSDQESEDIK